MPEKRGSMKMILAVLMTRAIISVFEKKVRIAAKKDNGNKVIHPAEPG